MKLNVEGLPEQYLGPLQPQEQCLGPLESHLIIDPISKIKY